MFRAFTQHEHQRLEAGVVPHHHRNLMRLAASGQLSSTRFSDYAAVGELALDGTLRAVKGALSMALSAREQGKRGLIVPVENAREAAVVDGIEVFAVGSLTVVFDLAYSTFLPLLVPREDVVEAQGRLSVSRSASYIGGPALGGVLVQVLTAPASTTVSTRKPSHLTSNSQFGSSNAAATSVAFIGGMKVGLLVPLVGVGRPAGFLGIRSSRVARSYRS